MNILILFNIINTDEIHYKPAKVNVLEKIYYKSPYIFSYGSEEENNYNKPIGICVLEHKTSSSSRASTCIYKRMHDKGVYISVCCYYTSRGKEDMRVLTFLLYFLFKMK